MLVDHFAEAEGEVTELLLGLADHEVDGVAAFDRRPVGVAVDAVLGENRVDRSPSVSGVPFVPDLDVLPNEVVAVIGGSLPGRWLLPVRRRSVAA